MISWPLVNACRDKPNLVFQEITDHRPMGLSLIVSNVIMCDTGIIHAFDSKSFARWRNESRAQAGRAAYCTMMTVSVIF